MKAARIKYATVPIFDFCAPFLCQFLCHFVRNLGAIRDYASVPRQSRFVEAGIPLHITARGNYQQTIFHTAEDRAEYLKLLTRHSRTEGLELLGWCLMTNHVHLLAIPERREAPARTMKRTQAD